MFNNSSNLYGSEWLALVFSNRNKNYGAYVLRSQSSNIVVKALLIVVPVFIMLFVGPMMYAQFHKDKFTTPKVIVVTIADPIHTLKKEEQKKEEPKKEKPIQEVQVKTVSIPSIIKVVDDNLVTTPPPTTVQIENAVIASTTQNGVEGKLNVMPTTGNIGGGIGNTLRVRTMRFMILRE